MVAAYFDCFSGICGDMILGSLIDLGLDEILLIKELDKLNIPGYKIKIKKVEINHITATDFSVQKMDDLHHRSFSDIKKLIDDSGLDKNIIVKSKNILLKIATVEAKIHNIDVEKVHFHEIGAVDSIIDIVGAVIGMDILKIDETFCSPLPLGKGFVKCSHGLIPIPAPATIELLKNVPVYQTGRNQELVTPTGAAIITSFTKEFCEIPLMKIKKVGYGSGKIKSRYPNILRIFLGEKYII
jgi:uncharacterized protein (TIGR00299 family) protein